VFTLLLPVMTSSAASPVPLMAALPMSVRFSTPPLSVLSPVKPISRSSPAVGEVAPLAPLSSVVVPNSATCPKLRKSASAPAPD
jgi:hypothetical protein